ncbi:hypothetical protein EBU99_05185 [bacterium]|nr:hypothetical protein [bacterium]
MRLADLSMVPWTNELGSDLLTNTELKTAYDALGRPTHLVAYLSNASFQSMYGAHAWSSVFISGLWLLFSRTSSGYLVTCRTTGTRYECVFASGQLDIPEVSFFRRGRRIATSKVRNLSLDELEWDDRGIHWLARRLVRFIENEMGPGVREWVQSNNHVSVHILPERALPKDFRAAAVTLQ